MDPNTGRFHELKEVVKNVKASEYTVKSVFPEFGGEPPLHPSHQEMVVKATGKPVPKHWPVFAIGEAVEVFNNQFEVAQITSKDLFVRGNASNVKRDDVCDVKGRSFRVRKVDGHFVVLRPIIGRLTRT